MFIRNLKLLKNTILNRYVFTIISFIYIFLKYLFYNKFSSVTYFIIIYSFLVFFNQFFNDFKIIKKNSNYFTKYFLGILLIIISLVSILINGIEDTKNALVFLSIFIVNLLVYMHIFIDVNFDKMKKGFINLCGIVLIFTFFYSIVECFFVLTEINIDVFGITWGIVNVDEYKRLAMGCNANMIAWLSSLSIGCSFMFILLFKNKTILFIVSIINVFTELFVIWATQSKSAILGLIFTFFCILIISSLYYGFFIKMIKIVFIHILILAILVILFLFVIENDIRIFDVGSNFVRLDIIIYGLYVLNKTNIIFGSGFANLIFDWKYYNDEINNLNILFTDSMNGVTELVALANAHNVFFQQLFYNGLIGLITLILLFFFYFKDIYVIIKNIRLLDKDNFYFFIIIISFLIFIFFITNFGMNTLFTITQLSAPFIFISLSCIDKIYNHYFLEDKNENL